MRTVVETRQVAHLWANKSQDNAHNPGGNLSFIGAVINSYGYHFAIAMHLENGAILWNDTGYSSTTRKHKSHVNDALTRAQRERLIHVPMMAHNETRDIERKHNNPDGKTLPILAEMCAARVLEAMQTIGKASPRATRVISDAWHTAKKYEASGLALCAYVAKGKRAPAWPLTVLPAELPSDAAERAALVRSMVKKQLLADYKSKIASARAIMADVSERVNGPADHYSIQNLAGRVNNALAYIGEASKAYETATGKKPPLSKMRNELSALGVAATAKRAEFDHLHALHERAEFLAHAFKALRLRKHGENKPYFSTRWQDAGFLVSKYGERFALLSADEARDIAPVLARLERIAQDDSARNAIAAARQSFDSAEAYYPQFLGDAKRSYGSARDSLKTAQRMAGAGFARMLRAACGTPELQHNFNPESIDAAIQTCEAAIAAKHAADIDAWKSGENVRLSFDAGTFARIKGEKVETSRGANVPLAHACRLARIARRIIAAGGKTWASGNGPRVGGFQVNSIAADGAAVIGCHEFDAAESMRLLALLEACPECLAVTTDADELTV